MTVERGFIESCEPLGVFLKLQNDDKDLKDC